MSRASGLRVAGLLLAPLLLVQASRVRRRTPRLPEASGPRMGSSGTGAPIRVLILGDSAAAGVGVAKQDQALSGRLAAELEGSFRVDWTLQAQTGLAVRDLVLRLEAAAAQTFDCAVVSVGVNDVTGGTANRSWCAGLTQLVGLLATKFGARAVLLTAVPPMHRFSALPQPLRWYLGARARELDGLLAEFALRSNGCERIAPTLPQAGGFLAADGFHPGAPAYACWARSAAAAIRTRFSGSAS